MISPFAGHLNPRVCRTCHGEIGMLGVLGCKCAGNVQAVLEREKAEKQRKAHRDWRKSHPRVPKTIPCGKCGKPFEKRTRSNLCAPCRKAGAEEYLRDWATKAYQKKVAAAGRQYRPYGPRKQKEAEQAE